MKPDFASASVMRSSSMPSTMSSETSLPDSMTALALRPSGVPALTAARRRSPVEMCGTLSSAFSIAAWVPLPEPGAPSKTSRMLLRCGRRAAEAKLRGPSEPTLAAGRKRVKRHYSGEFMAKGNLLYAQSGGVTAVINASAAGVIETARKKGVRVLAARNGIIGALREDLIDTGKESTAALAALRRTPGGAFGSCRYKLKSIDQNRAQYERLIEVFKAHDIRWFLYNG